MMKSIVCFVGVLIVISIAIAYKQEKIATSETSVPSEIDVTNDPSVTLHFGDHVRFKHGFYSGIEGDIIGVEGDGTFVVKSSIELSEYHSYDNTIRDVKPETLEVVPQPILAPDLPDLF